MFLKVLLKWKKHEKTEKLLKLTVFQKNGWKGFSCFFFTPAFNPLSKSEGACLTVQVPLTH